MTDELWECDGFDENGYCGFVGSEEEVEAHVIAEGNEVDNDPSHFKCWGAMKVGGGAWTNFHVNGVHPMSYVVGLVDEALMKHSELIPEVFKEDKEDEED